MTTNADNTNETAENTTTTAADMTEKLKEAGKKAETQKAARRERAVKGSHLLETLKTKASDAGLNVEEKSSFYKVTGVAKGRAVYIAKKGGRVDLSGFAVASAAITNITEEEAQAKHLGKVRGTVDFNKTDAEVLEAYTDALHQLKVAPAPASAAAATETK